MIDKTAQPSIAAFVFGLAVVALLVKRAGWSARIITGTLALFWIWMGSVYHISHFSTINPSALVFGVLFIVQGIILAKNRRWKEGPS
jgi:hypothetical protein